MEIIKIVLTSLLSVFALFIITKVMGHKQIAQFDFFDYIIGITFGSIGAELATELEKPLNPLIAMVVFGIASMLFNIVTRRAPRMRKLINGSPTIVMDNGRLYRKNMKKAKLDLSEFMVMCRELGYFNLDDIQTAVFEYNGKLTILPVCDKRPMTPADMNITPKSDNICTEIIIDGRILHENLKRKGLNLKWLQKQLESQGFHDAKEVFLGVCSSDNKLSLFVGE